jgi:O-antigen/teichoic acid export membrane protein
MQSSYTKNYLKIYLWQGVSLVLNFLSMFIVIPYLTSEPTIYGIYTVCISVSIFLAYADLGFLGAGQKYAAEYFAQGKRQEEIQVIGFTNFILFVFLAIFSLGFLILSFHPEFLIKDLAPGKQETIASSLLLILALFTPVTLLQRLLQMIFGIRLEDYIIQRTNIVASLLKILSVLWFFRIGEYNIVGYFLFVQIVNLLAALLTLLIAKKRYNYNFKFLVKSIHFNKNVFSKTKNLAFTSLFLMFTWILYYELDPTIIGKYLGANQVAIYAIGLTILSFFRSILGILFSPFNARFNHFIGIGDDEGLKSIYLNVTTVLAPIVVIPIVTITLLASPLILSWVGVDYLRSVEITQYLVLCNLFAFITYPASILLMAKERIKEMYLISTLIPIIYWTGIIFTYHFFGLKSFAIFKLIAFGTSAIGYYIIMIRFLKINIFQSLKEFFMPMLLPILFLIGVSYVIIDHLPVEKSKMNLLIVSIIASFMMAIAFVIQYLMSSKVRNTLKGIITILSPNNKLSK